MTSPVLNIFFPNCLLTFGKQNKLIINGSRSNRNPNNNAKGKNWKKETKKKKRQIILLFSHVLYKDFVIFIAGFWFSFYDLAFSFRFRIFFFSFHSIPTSERLVIASFYHQFIYFLLLFSEISFVSFV